MSDSLPTAVAAARRALIIDDEPVIRVALRRFFQRQGWTVDEAEDGRDALAMLLHDDDAATSPYDVVISDLRMPGLSGMELFERLAALRPALLARLIFSTGDAVSPDAASFLERSGRPVLSKPFEFAELRAFVSQLVDP